MADKTSIEWATHTWSPWVGCTAVSPACDHCYAEAWAKRSGHPELWQGERRRTSAAYWQKPLKWDREALAAGERHRVFPSLCDPFDNQVPQRWRDDFWHRIEQTPNLDWLLLTKRPQNIARMLPDPRTGTKPWGDGWHNVWLGTTAENQEEADRRIPLLLDTPAAKRFISAEPLLGPVDIERYLRRMIVCPNEELTDRMVEAGWSHPGGQGDHPSLDWVIAGGESGPGARPMEIWWACSLIEQCRSAGVACFVKQMGGNAISTGAAGADPDGIYRYRYRDRKGGDWNEWMSELRVREFPPAAGRMLDGREHSEFPPGWSSTADGCRGAGPISKSLIGARDDQD